MEVKKAIILALLTLNAWAHDEGHGPKISDTGRYGGLLAAVVHKSDAAKGAHAELKYKAELSRTESTIRVYLYDKDMKPLDLKSFEKSAKGMLAAKTKEGWKEVSVILELKGKVFQGQMPKPPGKPYNLDITFKENGTDLLSAFDNLD
jgi:hypothetical protein